MWWYDWKMVSGAKALERMCDELFDDDGNVKERKIPRIRKEFIAKMNQDPVMRYDWRHWNVGVFDAKVFAKMCDALQIKFEVRKKNDDSVVSVGFDHSSPFRRVTLVNFINSLDYIGLYATLDGIRIERFDFNHNVDRGLGENR